MIKFKKKLLKIYKKIQILERKHIILENKKLNIKANSPIMKSILKENTNILE